MPLIPTSLPLFIIQYLTELINSSILIFHLTSVHEIIFHIKHYFTSLFFIDTQNRSEVTTKMLLLMLVLAYTLTAAAKAPLSKKLHSASDMLPAFRKILVHSMKLKTSLCLSNNPLETLV